MNILFGRNGTGKSSVGLALKIIRVFLSSIPTSFQQLPEELRKKKEIEIGLEGYSLKTSNNRISFSIQLKTTKMLADEEWMTEFTLLFKYWAV